MPCPGWFVPGGVDAHRGRKHVETCGNMWKHVETCGTITRYKPITIGENVERRMTKEFLTKKCF